MGPCLLPISSCSSVTQSSAEGERGTDQSHPDLPQVALSHVVVPGDGDASGAPHPSAPLQAGSGETLGASEPAIPGPSGGSAHQGLNLDLDEEDHGFLSHHISSGTSSKYGYAVKKFSAFCSKFGVSTSACPPSIVVKYIRHMHDSGASYQTINLHKSAISKHHGGCEGKTMGMHPLVRQAMKAAFRLNPPLPKYQHTFDIEILLKYVKKLPPNECLPFKMLSYKTLLLTIYSTLSRVSSIARLGPHITENRDHVVLHLLHLEKQSRPGHVRGYIPIEKFSEDPSLCPVAAIIEYHAKVIRLDEFACLLNRHLKLNHLG